MLNFEREHGLHLSHVKTRGVHAPLRRPFETASGALKAVPLLLVDLFTREGPVGRSYLFCPAAPLLRPLAATIEVLTEMLEGAPLAPAALDAELERRVLLLGGTGLVTMARGGLDMAVWDAIGQAVGKPLADLWGGTRCEVPAYESSGLGMGTSEALADEARGMVEAEFDAIKLRLGYPSLAEDLRVAEAVRDAVGPETHLFVDYNQSLTAPEAIRRVRALGHLDLGWIEEPVRADDVGGCARVRAAAPTPIQVGENFFAPREARCAIDAGACDLIMPDVMKIGGASRWLRCAALAEASNIPISSHLFPEISAHLLAVAPTAHYLEYTDWASAILTEPAQARAGRVTVSKAPGAGITWDEEAIRHYAV